MQNVWENKVNWQLVFVLDLKTWKFQVLQTVFIFLYMQQEQFQILVASLQKLPLYQNSSSPRSRPQATIRQSIRLRLKDTESSNQGLSIQDSASREVALIVNNVVSLVTLVTYLGLNWANSLIASCCMQPWSVDQDSISLPWLPSGAEQANLNARITSMS